MNNEPAKDFGEIADDYEFFVAHATEAQEDARAYTAQLGQIVPPGGIVRMLDFGCGSGDFTARLLGEVGWLPERLRLTLVEPVESIRRQAIARLERFTESAISESSSLPPDLVARFDVVLSNHVLYYVPELSAVLRQLAGALAPMGVLLAAIAGLHNVLIQFWLAGFTLLDREVPYNTSEDVEDALRELGMNYEKQQVAYELRFPDTEENRMRIVRFLLADHLADMPHRPLLDMFDRYSKAGRIEIQTASDHYTLRPSSNSGRVLSHG
jgi:trans-aconitate 2-methyltransferase